MKTLTILRHAKSSSAEANLDDHDRPLTEPGENDALIMGDRIKAAGIRPSLIISSSALRAWQTARIVAKQLSYPIEFLYRESDLYHAEINRLFDLIAAQDEGFNNIMVVGHNPGLTNLSNELVPEVTSNIPTAGFVSVLLETDSWDLHNFHSCELIKYEHPKRHLSTQSTITTDDP